VDAGDQHIAQRELMPVHWRERDWEHLRGGGETTVGHSETLGSLRVAQVLRLSLDTVTGVPAAVSYSYVEH
jgi:hypothetical protein